MPLSLPASRSEIVSACNSVLDRIFTQKAQEAQQIGQEYHQLLHQINILTSRGGKRLRPLLTVWGYQAFGGDRPAIMQVAAAQELFHAFILIHDDFIDRDNRRWGGLNVSGVYQRLLARSVAPSDRRHYADSLAILAGDICQVLSDELLLTADFPASSIQAVALIMKQTEQAMIGGETLDVLLPFKKTFPSIERIIRVYHHKTALYSFLMPLKIGAILAGASKTHLKVLEEFAVPLGIAYQIQDDDIGMFGNESETGKSVTTDLAEGKRTVLMAYGLRGCNEPDREFLQNILGKTDVSAQDHRRAKAILTATGAREKAQRLMHRYTAESATALSRLPIDETVKKTLRQLSEELLKRRQ